MIRWLYLFGILLLSSCGHGKADTPIHVMQVPLSTRSVVLDPENIYNKKEDQEKIILLVNELNIGDNVLDITNKIGLPSSYYTKLSRKPFNCAFGKYILVYQFNKSKKRNDLVFVDRKSVNLYFSKDEKLTNISNRNVPQIKERGIGCQGAMTGGV